MQTSGNLGFTLTNIKFKSEVAFSNAYQNASYETNQKNALDSAAHSLESEKAIFDLLSFSENYTFSATEESLEKSSEAKIDFSKYSVPLEISRETEASSDSWSLSQNLKAKANFTPRKFKIKAEGKAAQKILTDSATSNGESKFSTENYFSSWTKITEFSFNKGNEKAAKRNVGGKASLSYSFDKAHFTPKIFFELDGNYKSASKVTFTDTEKTGFELPFSVKKNNFAFSWKKSAGSVASENTNQVKITKGGDYARDSEELQTSLTEKSYFLKSAPIYDLVSKNLSKNVFSTERDSNYYTGAYAFSWKRAFFANKHDFFIPQSAKLEAARDIRTGTSISDFYQIKNTVNYTALNIFGKNGTLPIFSFFSNDEYNSSFSGAVKIPRENPSKYSYILSGYVQATFYFSEKNYLKNGLEGSIEGKENWKAKYTLVWKRNARTSLARGIVSIFSEEKAKKVIRITKTDSLNTSASCASGTNSLTRKYAIAYIHETETQITKFVSINTAVGAEYWANWQKIATLTANATIGATVRF